MFCSNGVRGGGFSSCGGGRKRFSRTGGGSVLPGKGWNKWRGQKPLSVLWDLNFRELLEDVRIVALPEAM